MSIIHPEKLRIDSFSVNAAEVSSCHVMTQSGEQVLLMSPRFSSPKLLSNMTYLLARLRSGYSWVLALVFDWIKWFGNSSSASTKICQNNGTCCLDWTCHMIMTWSCHVLCHMIMTCAPVNLTFCQRLQRVPVLRSHPTNTCTDSWRNSQDACWRC